MVTRTLDQQLFDEKLANEGLRRELRTMRLQLYSAGALLTKRDADREQLDEMRLECFENRGRQIARLEAKVAELEAERALYDEGEAQRHNVTGAPERSTEAA